MSSLLIKLSGIIKHLEKRKNTRAHGELAAG